MCRARILANMKDYGHKWVNPMCALRGLDADSNATSELESLVREGLILRNTVTLGKDKFNRPIHAPLYKYNGPYDDPFTKHLTVVK